MKGRPFSNHKEDLEKQEIKMMISNLREEMNRSNNFMMGEINLSNAQLIGEMKKLE
jgi:hypothetical protein